MDKKRKAIQKAVFIIFLLTAIIALFYWYTIQNNEHIRERNKDYAASSAKLKTLQIDKELHFAQNLINTYAYLLEKSLTEPSIDTDLLQEMEEDSLFDALRFTDMEGNNYASDGSVSDASERDYYLEGTEGKSGISVIFQSMISGETMVGFYAPVRYNGEIIGVLRGVYLAQVYLKDMLNTVYFDEEAEAYLCMPDGRIIASSDDEIYEGYLLNEMVQANIIDENTSDHVNEIFKSGGEDTFICESDSKTDNISVMYLPENDYVLVQTFPKSVTQSMIKAGNLSGIQLEVMLIVLFVIYIMFLLIQSRQQKKLLERQTLNIAEIKERELHTQAEISRANRRERQYRIAAASNAIYTFEYNLTKDLIEEDITCTADGQKRSLLEHAGMKAPCKASEWFENQKQFIAPESIKSYCKTVDAASMKNRFEQGDAEVAVQYWSKDCSDKKICVRESFIMTRDSDTDDIMVMVVAKEITDNVKKEMERTLALQEALRQAQHANKAKTSFLSNMSHDIRTPMNAVIGFTTLALDHIHDEAQVEDCLRNVLASSNNLLELINQILDMSRIESGKAYFEEEAADFSKIVRSLIDIIRPQAEQKQLELIVDTSGIFDNDIITDHRKLGQILYNLLNNAVKYTPAGGKISFQIKQKQTFHSGYGDYVFTVQDNGIGMSPEFLKHIFEPFEREMSATKSGIQGAGLGMAITKYLVDMMGGSIHVQSNPQEGSLFTVELTLKTQNTVQNISQTFADFHGKRILLVEDIALNRKIAEVMLTKAGFAVEYAPDGTDAVAMVEKSDEYYYDAILMDLQMPVMDGYEATRQIRALSRADAAEIPIIAVTANAFAEDREAALKSGMNAHVAKPLDRETLLKVLGQYI